MGYPTVLGTASLALLATGLPCDAMAQVPAYAGIFAFSNYGTNGASLSNGDTHQLDAAFANPFVSGVTVASTWRQVEPLPPGVNFAGSGVPITLTLGGASVTLSCVIPGSAMHTPPDGNYCYDTIDPILNEIQQEGRNFPTTYTTTDHGTVTVPALAIGLSIQAGFHSPIWLSDAPVIVDTVSDTGIQLDFSADQVAAATSGGFYSNYATASCADYAGSTGGSFSSGVTPCGIGQTFTSWIGFVGGSPSSTKTKECSMVRLPVPFDVQVSGGTTTTLAAFAQPYVDMIAILKNHIESHFGKIAVVKLGNALAGEDAEMTMLGGNKLGSIMALYPPDLGSTTATGTAQCGGPPSGNATFPDYNYVWQNTYGYNPRLVELTWEFIADSVGSTFNVGSAGTTVLLNLDVHTDTNTTFPNIPFQETNANTSTIYTQGASGNYDYTSDGPNIQDDMVLCDLVGTYTPSTGTSLYLAPTVGTTGTIAGPYYAGFHGTGINHCLTGNRTNHHQPLTFSLPHGYQWGIEQDGLIPVVMNSVPGPYAQGIARLFGLKLSWGMNGGNAASCGNSISSSGSTVMVNCTSATNQSSTCGTAYDGDTTTTCSTDMMNMLDSGLYPATTPTGQYYAVAAGDLCNPFLWLGLAQSNESITGLPLTTADLGTIGGTTAVFRDCHHNLGTFSASGTFTE